MRKLRMVNRNDESHVVLDVPEGWTVELGNGPDGKPRMRIAIAGSASHVNTASRIAYHMEHVCLPSLWRVVNK